ATSALDDLGAQAFGRVASCRGNDRERGLLQRAKLRTTGLAARDMRADGARLVRLEGADRERGEIVDRVAGHRCTSSSPSHSRSRAMPSRTRLFTVPIGAPGRPAIRA